MEIQLLSDNEMLDVFQKIKQEKAYEREDEMVEVSIDKNVVLSIKKIKTSWGEFLDGKPDENYFFDPNSGNASLFFKLKKLPKDFRIEKDFFHRQLRIRLMRDRVYSDYLRFDTSFKVELKELIESIIIEIKIPFIDELFYPDLEYLSEKSEKIKELILDTLIGKELDFFRIFRRHEEYSIQEDRVELIFTEEQAKEFDEDLKQESDLIRDDISKFNEEVYLLYEKMEEEAFLNEYNELNNDNNNENEEEGHNEEHFSRHNNVKSITCTNCGGHAIDYGDFSKCSDCGDTWM